MIQYSLFGAAGYQPAPELTRLPVTLFRWGWGALVLLRRPLIPDLLKLSPDDCLFYENGEKEYSCEITRVHDGAAELLRYTVDWDNSGDGIVDIYNFRLQSEDL